MNKDIELNNGAEAALLACLAELGGYVGKGTVKKCDLKKRFATLAQRLPNDPSCDDEVVLVGREEAVTRVSERTAQLAAKRGELLAILRAAQQPFFFARLVHLLKLF